MSSFRPSREVVFVMPVTPCLVAVYAIDMGRGACAEIEPLLMMRPPFGDCAFMIRIACWQQRKVPVRFAATTACHFSKGRSSIGIAGAPVPALLKRTSRRPNADFTFSKRARTDSGWPTSAGTASARLPAPDSSTAFSSGSLRRPASATE